MSITVLCPDLKCRMVLAVPEETRGKKVRCKFCGTTFVVPQRAKKRKHIPPEGVQTV